MGLAEPEKKINWAYIFIGLIALIIGVVLYVYDRQMSSVYFVPDILNQHKSGTSVFGLIGYYLPSFLHVFAFCWISVGILGNNPERVMFICLFWLFVDGNFELAQNDAIASVIVPFIPDWFKGIPFLENTAAYLLKGRFDPVDLAAIYIGAITSYLLITSEYLKNPIKNISDSDE